jgi:two-component system, cell cycle response regulator CpdR
LAALLIVDDDAEVLEALSAVLTIAGHEVERAAGRLLALDILDRGKPLDLLLTDVIMPGLNGLNLARMTRLRRADIRVLYISGFNELEKILQDDGPRLGKLLSKPIMPADLQREVEEALAAPPSGYPFR